ncbi:hypothetical protein H5410_037431 [Solanum commersonii]|uniref:Retrovirus-related Pol polyprotein from transposon TNT 1-94-like beta-barrel domain-containing protein n=1 Tax=Solanum commersonii TaxID=4109 RepID=A0A9J5Y8G3_SOLCO|nr:hypothetical protein H5410_037431 [Solanum commersonii]
MKELLSIRANEILSLIPEEEGCNLGQLLVKVILGTLGLVTTHVQALTLDQVALVMFWGNFPPILQVLMYSSPRSSQISHPSAPHFTREQFNQILQMIGQNSETSGTALSVGMVNPSNQWIADTRATNHMVNDHSLLSNTRSLLNTNKGNVMLLPGNTAKVSHLGSSTVLGRHDIHNVMYIPEFQHNLLSVSKLTKELNCSVHFYPDFCTFQDLFNGKVKETGKHVHGLYVVDSPCLNAGHNKPACIKTRCHSVLVEKSKNKADIDLCLWHKRLGHAP